MYYIVVAEINAPLLFNLIETADTLRSEVEGSFDDARLSLARAGLLSRLSDGPLPLSVLADRLHCGRSNITSMVDRLERDGWVKREADPKDRRMSVAAMTPEGRGALDQALSAVADREASVADSLGPEGAKTLLTLLAKI